MKKRKSYSIALGGIVSALSLVFMFSTASMPLLSVCLPAISGGMLAIIVIELSKKWAYLSYIAIAVLSFFVTPDKEAALLFAMFFGYYPILKSSFENIKSLMFQWAVKIATFNTAIIVFFLTVVYVLGITDMLEEFDDFGKYTALIIVAVANFAFIAYDIALSDLITRYIKSIRKKFIKG